MGGSNGWFSRFELIGLDGTVSTVAHDEALIPIERARRFVLDSCPVLRPRRVTLEESLGCVCAEDMRASEDLPPFANSAVDGYAVRSEDVRNADGQSPVVLDVIAEVAAGSSTDVVVGQGQAVRIMTGAPVPAGADAIVMVENTRLSDSQRMGDVEVLGPVSRGAAVRAVGDDVRTGDLVFPAGTPITPMVLGVLSSMNCRNPFVFPKPRVAVLSTGDELIDDGSPLGPGQIRESNRKMLLGLLDRAGAVGVDYGIVRDDESFLEEVLRRAGGECDAIVTSGGVSMGDYDVVKAVLGRIADMAWMQIAIKPAKPFALGHLTEEDRTVPIFGLPGNPVSSMVSFELLARPALRKMAGLGSEDPGRPRVLAVADEPFRRSADGKIHYQRVAARFAEDGRVHVTPVRAQGSHQLAASALANGLAVVPDGSGIESGQDIEVVLLVS